MSDHAGSRVARTRGPAWAVPVLLSGLLLAGCARDHPGQVAGPDAVVLIVIDTLRADHLGAWGYEKAVTPHLDALAAEGLRFTDVTTPAPVTLPAVCSLLTGRLPPAHGVRDNVGFVLPEEEETLAERFQRAGWRTGAVVGSAVLARDRGVAQGFGHYDDHFAPPYTVHEEAYLALADEMARDRRRADRVTDLAIERIQSFGRDRFFLLVHYFDVHAYYDPPPEHGRLHPGRPYDGEITFVDAEIGRLLASLAQRPDALVIVVSDHGEGLDEHGEPEHGFLLYQSTLHVPVIVWGRGIEAGIVRDDPVSLVDLEPSVAAWTNLAPSDGVRQGRVLAFDATPAPPTALYAETFRTLVSYQWSELRALRQGRWKLIHGPRDEFYDLVSDPRERADLGALHPAAGPLREEMESIVRGDPPAAVLRSWTAEDEGRRELLESLGYVGAGPASADPPADRPHPLDQLPRWKERQRNRVRFREAGLLIRQGDLAAARAKLDTFLVEEPDRADAWHNRALVRKQQGDAEGARADLREALRVDPGYAPALEETAADLVAQGRIEEALTYLRRLVETNPQDADAHYNLGVAARTLGLREEARAHLERFLSLAPQDARAPRVREVLDEP